MADKPPVPVKIADLLKKSAPPERRKIMVTGKLADFKQRTSRAGNPYFTFRLTDAGGTINGYGRGKVAKVPTNGARVMVVGAFRKVKKLGNRTFMNEIDITPQGYDKPPRIAALPK